jgi:hypothetical protein
LATWQNRLLSNGCLQLCCWVKKYIVAAIYLPDFYSKDQSRGDSLKQTADSSGLEFVK